MNLFLIAVLLAASAAASRDLGRELFDAHGCRSCHRIGEKGGNAGPDLSLVGFRRTRQWIDLWLRDPRAWKPDTTMPKPGLSHSSRAALVGYLASLRGADRRQDAQLDGRVLYARLGCVACHGPGGQGGHPNNNVHGNAIPALPKLVATFTPEELRSEIRKGDKPQKADPLGPDPMVAMPAWGEILSEDEIAAVVEYLLSKIARDGKEDW